MGGYKFIIGFAVIILCAFIWIPLEYASTLTAEVMNLGITEASAISMNNLLARVFYYSLFFIILIVMLWTIKTDTEEEYGFN